MSAGPIEPISLGQFFLMVVVTILGGGVYIWPSAILADAGQASPYALGLSIGLAFALVWLQTLWPPYTHGASQLSRMRTVWGWMRWPLFLGSVTLYLALGGCLMASFSQMLHVNFYSLTPLWVFELTGVIVMGWLAAKPLSQVARNVQFWLPLLLGSFFVLAVMAISHLQTLAALRPSSVIPVWAVGKALLSTWFLWIQGDVIVTLGAHVRDVPWTRIRHWALAAIAFQGLMLIVIYVLVVGTLGVDFPSALEWPLVYIFSDLTISALLISRPDLLIIISWVIALLLYESVTLMVLTINIQDALSLPQSVRTILVWIFAAVLGGLATQIATPVVANNIVLHWINPTALGLTVFSSILAPLLVRRRRSRDTAGEG